MKPSAYTESTDYMSVANDGSGQIQITVPGSIVLTTGTSYTQEVVATIGNSAGALLRANGSSNKDGRLFYGTAFASINKGTAGAPISGSVQYYGLYYIYRKNTTQVALRTYIANTLSPAATLTTSSTPEIMTVNIKTFLVP